MRDDVAYPFVVHVPEEKAAVPVASVYCIGRNYAEHAAELNNPVPGEPVVFLKTTAALRGMTQGETAFRGETFHHEAEVVLLIGKTVELGATGGWEHVRALGLGLDLTRREVQAKLKEKGLPWTTAKSFAGSGLVTEMVPKARFASPDAIEFTLDVNGERRQTGDTRSMLFKVPVILTHLAKYHRLVPGDLVYTGTPKGVGPLRHGDSVALAFSGMPYSWSGAL